MNYFRDNQEKALEKAIEIFEGRTIKEVRYASEEEVKEMGWEDEVIVFTLSDGTLFYPSSDDEGKGPGRIFVQTKEERRPIEFYTF